jgi:hypothetical protein
VQIPFGTEAASVFAAAIALYSIYYYFALDASDAPGNTGDGGGRDQARLERRGNRRIAWLNGASAPVRPQPLASNHDKRGHHDKKRDWCVVKAMSACGDNQSRADSKRQRQQQRPSVLHNHSTNQGDR